MIDSFDDIEKQLNKLDSRFKKLESDYEMDIPIEHRRVDECLKDQITLLYEFEKMKSQIGYYKDLLDNRAEHELAYAYRMESTNNPRSLSSTEAKMYAQCSKDYVRAKQLRNKVYKINLECDAVLETLKQRGFALKHLSELIIAGEHAHVL